MAALAALTMSPAMSQELNGASVSGVFVSIEDENTTGFEGGADISLGGSFAVGANIGLYNGSGLDETRYNGTLHGMYMTSPNSAFGLFVARDSVGSSDVDSIGVEYGFGSDRGRFEAYYGAADSGSDSDASIAGLSFEFSAAEGFFLTLDYDTFVIADDASGVEVGVGTGAIGARYQFANGPSVYLEAGRVAIAATDGFATASEVIGEFVGIGVEMNFGRSSGALFSNRSTADAVGF
jgi:hypothetical protein